MPYKLRIKEEARLDIITGALWYRSKAQELDKKFVLAVEFTLKSITKNPFAFKRSYRKTREAGVKKFPYVIVYEIEGFDIVVYAVFNTWQNPKKKIKRLKR